MISSAFAKVFLTPVVTFVALVVVVLVQSSIVASINPFSVIFSLTIGMIGLVGSAFPVLLGVIAEQLAGFKKWQASTRIAVSFVTCLIALSAMFVFIYYVIPADYRWYFLVFAVSVLTTQIVTSIATEVMARD